MKTIIVKTSWVETGCLTLKYELSSFLQKMADLQEHPTGSSCLATRVEVCG